MKQLFIFTFLVFVNSAFASNEIIRPYQSLRSAAMGGLKTTTGLYDENMWWGNPARSTANPKFRFQFPDPMLEINPNSLSTMNSLLGASGSDAAISGMTGSAGKNNHARVQMTFPSVYFAPSEGNKLAFGLGIMVSLQTNLGLQQNYSITAPTYLDAGLNFNIARKFLDEDALSVGLNVHTMYRFASNSIYSLADMIRGTSINPFESAGMGGSIDFDIGGTYDLPLILGDFKFMAAGSVNNVLGGNYDKFTPSGRVPAPSQFRTFNIGVSAKTPTLWAFTDAVFALEFNDIGPMNMNGSIFRMIHIGTEMKWKTLRPRLGFYQGYIAAGFGVDLGFFQVDVATYGEEMTFNAGGHEDRRFGLRLSFQI
jgi:hypothetical protein